MVINAHCVAVQCRVVRCAKISILALSVLSFMKSKQMILANCVPKCIWVAKCVMELLMIIIRLAVLSARWVIICHIRLLESVFPVQWLILAVSNVWMFLHANNAPMVIISPYSTTVFNAKQPTQTVSTVMEQTVYNAKLVSIYYLEVVTHARVRAVSYVSKIHQLNA